MLGAGWDIRAREAMLVFVPPDVVVEADTRPFVSRSRSTPDRDPATRPGRPEAPAHPARAVVPGPRPGTFSQLRRPVLIGFRLRPQVM